MDLERESELNEREDTYISTEKETGRYYLGTPRYIPGNEHIILEISVSARTFLEFQYHDIMTYLSQYSIHPRRFIEYCDIIQLKILENGDYSCIIKTYWLRLIQRTWKRVYQKKREYIKKIQCIHSLKRRSIYGRFGHGPTPSLKGMLCCGVGRLFECE